MASKIPFFRGQREPSVEYINPQIGDSLGGITPRIFSGTVGMDNPPSVPYTINFTGVSAAKAFIFIRKLHEKTRFKPVDASVFSVDKLNRWGHSLLDGRRLVNPAPGVVELWHPKLTGSMSLETVKATVEASFRPDGIGHPIEFTYEDSSGDFMGVRRGLVTSLRDDGFTLAAYKGFRNYRYEKVGVALCEQEPNRRLYPTTGARLEFLEPLPYGFEIRFDITYGELAELELVRWRDQNEVPTAIWRQLELDPQGKMTLVDRMYRRGPTAEM